MKGAGNWIATALAAIAALAATAQAYLAWESRNATLLANIHQQRIQYCAATLASGYSFKSTIVSAIEELGRRNSPAEAQALVMERTPVIEAAFRDIREKTEALYLVVPEGFVDNIHKIIRITNDLAERFKSRDPKLGVAHAPPKTTTAADNLDAELFGELSEFANECRKIVAPTSR